MWILSTQNALPENGDTIYRNILCTISFYVVLSLPFYCCTIEYQRRKNRSFCFPFAIVLYTRYHFSFCSHRHPNHHENVCMCSTHHVFYSNIYDKNKPSELTIGSLVEKTSDDCFSVVYLFRCSFLTRVNWNIDVKKKEEKLAICACLCV